MSLTELYQAGALVFLSFLSEDAATLSGATLCLYGSLPLSVAYWACFLGIWIGDIGIYVIARFLGPTLLERPWVKRRISQTSVEQAEAWIRQRGAFVLLACRMTPGLRVPVYVVAGTLRMPSILFGAVTGLAAIIWVGAIFAAALALGPQIIPYLKGMNHVLATLTLFATLGILLVLVTRYPRSSGASRAPLARYLHWEFWPAWLFYGPVVLYYLWLALKFRSLSLPTLANPGIFTGGIIGESKYATLKELAQTSPEFTARSFLILGESHEQRFEHFTELLASSGLSYPVVLKPNIGQRGSGFKVVRSLEEARTYLEPSANVLLQEYLPGPHEVGIFYYRFPNETRGHIFAITEKVFPVLFGDGTRTLRELILDDTRARLLTPIYFARWKSQLDSVVPFGQSVKLVQAGNHAQGCIFRDGWSLWTQALEDRIDAISVKINGFYIGRYDLRYESLADLQNATNFKILELNGAASEATSIYDAKNSIFTAYSTLFKQWHLVFTIGAANRALGHQSESISTLWSEYRRYQSQAAHHPVAD